MAGASLPPEAPRRVLPAWPWPCTPPPASGEWTWLGHALGAFPPAQGCSTSRHRLGPGTQGQDFNFLVEKGLEFQVKPLTVLLRHSEAWAALLSFHSPLHDPRAPWGPAMQGLPRSREPLSPCLIGQTCLVPTGRGEHTGALGGRRLPAALPQTETWGLPSDKDTNPMVPDPTITTTLTSSSPQGPPLTHGHPRAQHENLRDTVTSLKMTFARFCSSLSGTSPHLRSSSQASHTVFTQVRTADGLPGGRSASQL